MCQLTECATCDWKLLVSRFVGAGNAFLEAGASLGLTSEVASVVFSADESCPNEAAGTDTAGTGLFSGSASDTVGGGTRLVAIAVLDCL